MHTLTLTHDPSSRRIPRSAIPDPQSPHPLLRHAHHLPDPDRLLLDLFYRRRLTRQDIARLLALSTGTVSRRLTRLSTRLRDPLVLALLESPDPALAPLHRSLGIQHFLCRTPAAHLAKTHAMTPRRVKQILSYLQGWHRGAKVNPKFEAPNPKQSDPIPKRK